MAIYLDRHDVGESTAEDVAKLHVADLKIQDQYGVKFLTYWFDAERHTTFCLVDAPDKETAERVHREAHGHVAGEMIEVDLSAVEAFLGRVQDPANVPTKPIDDSAFRAIMFTDIVASTEMTARVGDVRAVEFVRVHDSIVRRCLTRNGGREVKHLGDGIMASFHKAPAAVMCALSIQAEMASYNSNSNSKIPLQIRIGLHAGEPVEDSRDLFGSSVQMAARLCDEASPEGTAASGDIKIACIGSDLKFERIATKTLKGFTEPVSLYQPH